MSWLQPFCWSTCRRLRGDRVKSGRGARALSSFLADWLGQLTASRSGSPDSRRALVAAGGERLGKRDSRVVETSPVSRTVRGRGEHDRLVVLHGDVMLGGDHVGAGKRGAKLRPVQMSAYCPVSLDGHHGVNVGLAVDDLAGGGHLRWQGIAGIGVCGGVAGGGGGDGEAVD